MPDIPLERSALERFPARALGERSPIEVGYNAFDCVDSADREQRLSRQEWRISRETIVDGEQVVTLLAAASPGTDRELRLVHVQTTSESAATTQLVQRTHGGVRGSFAVQQGTPDSHLAAFSSQVSDLSSVANQDTGTRSSLTSPRAPADFLLRIAPMLRSTTLQAIHALTATPFSLLDSERHPGQLRPESSGYSRFAEVTPRLNTHEQSLIASLFARSADHSFRRSTEAHSGRREEFPSLADSLDYSVERIVLGLQQRQHPNERHSVSNDHATRGISRGDRDIGDSATRDSERPESVWETIGKAKMAEAEAYMELGRAIAEGVRAVRDAVEIGAYGAARSMRSEYQAPDRYQIGDRLVARVGPGGFGPAPGDSRVVTEMKDFYRHAASNARMMEWTTNALMDKYGISRQEAMVRADAIVSGLGKGNEAQGFLIDLGWNGQMPGSGFSFDPMRMPNRLMQGQQLLQAFELDDELNNAYGRMLFMSDPNFNVDLFEAKAHLEIEMQRLKELSEGLMNDYSEREYSLGVEGIGTPASSTKEYSLGINYESVFSSDTSGDGGSDVEGGLSEFGAGEAPESDADSGQRGAGSSGEGGGWDHDHGRGIGEGRQSGGNQGGGDQSSGGSCNTGNEPGGTGGQCTPGGTSGETSGGNGSETGGGEGGGEGGGGEVAADAF